MKPIVLITQGDHNGIGPEIALRTALTKAVRTLCVPVLVGSIDVYEYYASRFQGRTKITLREIEQPASKGTRYEIPAGLVPVINVNRFEGVRIRPGAVSAAAGRFAGDALRVAVTLCMRNRVHAIVTAPVSKEAMNLGGYDYPGQTDMLARLSRTKRYAMLLVANDFRVGLTTIHVPLKAVHRSISRQRVFEKLQVISRSLRRDFAIPSPTIAVLGLNPHAGEHGILGSEESRHILPAIMKARAARIRVDGPYPADGFFATHSHRAYDAVLAMYHDQGLIPLKMMGFKKGVNFTAGLPIVRTSPGHGTAFDIAGKGVSDASSMIEATRLAVSIAMNRTKGN